MSDLRYDDDPQPVYGPRYGPFSTYAPHVSWAWRHPADEHDRTDVLWTPPGHAYPVLPAPVRTEPPAETKEGAA